MQFIWLSLFLLLMYMVLMVATLAANFIPRFFFIHNFKTKVFELIAHEKLALKLEKKS